ncbi:SDR family oxidoreductase [Kineococcus sp. T13]|uniref:SDR family oxidoreductase n=1 Tax=Kineococcus vitellinus TaxID=2696565 RepID=UPI0014134705|nr:SDR family oxidoreductase [Kineococcus vitellinus]
MQGTVVVTGGSRGIGAAVVRALAARGVRTCFTYSTHREAADVVAAQAADLGTEAVPVQADVSVEGEVRRLFTQAQQLGPITGLVNNAGITGRQSAFVDLEVERVRRVLDVNVVGAFLCAREAVRRMAATGGGTIVNVSSRAAVLGGAGEYVDYAASKAAVDAMTVGLAREVAAHGIRVAGVRPGLIRTDIHASAGEPERVERLKGTVPMGRGGEADEVAEAVVWLLSDAASYVTGTTLDVSGGR